MDSPRDAALYLTMLGAHVCVRVCATNFFFSLSLFLEEEEEEEQRIER